MQESIERHLLLILFIDCHVVAYGFASEVAHLQVVSRYFMEVPINEKSRVLLIKVVMHILDVSIFAPIVDEKGENYKTPRASLLELGNLNPPVLIKTTQEVYVPLKLETSFLEVFIMVKEVLD